MGSADSISNDIRAALAWGQAERLRAWSALGACLAEQDPVFLDEIMDIAGAVMSDGSPMPTGRAVGLVYLAARSRAELFQLAGAIYSSQRAAARALGVAHSTLNDRIRRDGTPEFLGQVFRLAHGLGAVRPAYASRVARDGQTSGLVRVLLVRPAPAEESFTAGEASATGS